MQRIIFILHGKLKKIEHIKQAILEVFTNKFKSSFKTTSKDGAFNITIEAVNENPDIIIICGGDGSINELVNGYLNSNSKKKINFGILPMGTGNDFVKSLKTSKRISNLKNLIIQNKIVSVDLFKMNFKNHQENFDSRFFVNVSDIGIGGFVAKKISKSNRFLNANLTYFKAIIYSFLKYKKQKITLTCNNFNWEGSVMSLSMANGKYFGSGLCIAPNAKLNDGKLQLTVLGNVTILDYLLNLKKLKTGKIIEHPKVFYKEVESCQIKSLENKESPIDMDGEFIGYTPLEVVLYNKKINFYGND